MQLPVVASLPPRRCRESSNDRRIIPPCFTPPGSIRKMLGFFRKALTVCIAPRMHFHLGD